MAAIEDVPMIEDVEEEEHSGDEDMMVDEESDDEEADRPLCASREDLRGGALWALLFIAILNETEAGCLFIGGTLPA